MEAGGRGAVLAEHSALVRSRLLPCGVGNPLPSHPLTCRVPLSDLLWSFLGSFLAVAALGLAAQQVSAASPLRERVEGVYLTLWGGGDSLFLALLPCSGSTIGMAAQQVSSN